ETIAKDVSLLDADAALIRTLLRSATNSTTYVPAPRLLPLPGGGFIVSTARAGALLARIDANAERVEFVNTPDFPPLYWINAVAGQPDGKILIGGLVYLKGGGDTRPWLWRLNS